MEKFYTGVGSRDTPGNVCQLMTSTAKRLNEQGYILRSGGARGADYAFEIGADNPAIYIASETAKPVSRKPGIFPDLEAYRATVKKCCLHYKNIQSQYAKDLHTRNVCQVIGHDPKEIIRSDFLLAYTLNGDYVGGTTTAIRCAELFEVPVFNFGKYKTIKEMEAALDIFLAAYIKI